MRGFSALILIVLVGALLVGVSFLFRQNNVKGARTESEVTSPGFLVSIVSDAETWELNLYGCNSESLCERLSKTGGGATELKEITFPSAPNWSKYELLKLSIVTKDFRVLSAGDVPGTKADASSVTFPVNAVTEAFYRSAIFSDQ